MILKQFAEAMLLLGNSLDMGEALKRCDRYAATGYPILLRGEPGTGKTVLASYIHQASRRTGQLVKTSAATIPANLEQSYLGGHTRGSFTGAIRDQVGLLEAAHKGTFFLDELGIASAKVQEILLQVLDDGSLNRVGEVHPRLIDVRIVAATNADIETMMEAGGFRRDLRDRFGYLVVVVPPLRNRRDDILPLSHHFLRSEADVLGLDPVILSHQVAKLLLRAPWPGNVRELQSVCRYLAIFGEPGSPVTPNMLPPDFLAGLGINPLGALPDRARSALEKASGNKARAARMLGVSRQHLYRLLRTNPSPSGVTE